MYCLLICGLVDAGGVDSRADFLVMYGGVLFCADCLLSLTCGSKVFVLCFDGLGSHLGHVFEYLGCGVGGLINASFALQGGLAVGTGVFW